MANDVKSVVVSIFQEYGNINADEPASAVETLMKWAEKWKLWHK